MKVLVGHAVEVKRSNTLLGKKEGCVLTALICHPNLQSFNVQPALILRSYRRLHL